MLRTVWISVALRYTGRQPSSPAPPCAISWAPPGRAGVAPGIGGSGVRSATNLGQCHSHSFAQSHGEQVQSHRGQSRSHEARILPKTRPLLLQASFHIPARSVRTFTPTLIATPKPPSGPFRRLFFFRRGKGGEGGGRRRRRRSQSEKRPTEKRRTAPRPAPPSGPCGGPCVQRRHQGQYLTREINV